MGDGVVALILLIAFVASAILFARRRSSQIDDIERGLPAELRGAEIAYAERTWLYAVSCGTRGIQLTAAAGLNG